MGRVIVQQWVSVDGLLAGRNGEGDVFAAVDDFSASEAHNTALLDSVDEVLLGRRTYEIFTAFWPSARDQPMAQQINTLPKTVCSTSLEQAPWGDHAPARVVPDAVAHVREQRAAQTGDIIVWGSVSVARSLFAADEVDELELFIAPILLGGGTRLLTADDQPVSLRLQESENWPANVIHTRYAVNIARSRAAQRNTESKPE